MGLTLKTAVLTTVSVIALSGCSALGNLTGAGDSETDSLSTDTGATINTDETNTFMPAPVSAPTLNATGFTIQNVVETSAQFEPSPADPFAGMVPDPTDVPPNPLPGECYAQITFDPIYDTVEEQIIVEEARTETRIIPAVFGDVQDEVIIREQSVELLVVPATYRTVVEEIVIRPEARRLIPVEPVYETVMEQIEVIPARTVWKPGRGPIERIDNMTGEILCLVEEPAVYETVERRVMVTPATTREEIIPAVTETVTREVIDQPAGVQERIVPAVTQLVARRVEVQPAREEIIEIPAVTRPVNRQVLVQQARTEWRSILCETNTTPDVVRLLQSALSERGYDTGGIDGVMGPRTTSAIDRFQRENGMIGNGITMETLQLLGVSVSN